MIFTTFCKLSNFRRISRFFSSADREKFVNKIKEFPYQFNNIPPKKEYGKNIPSCYIKYEDWIKKSYRELLLSLEKGNIDNLSKIMEKRLFRRIQRDLDNFLDDGYKFILRNKESPIELIYFSAGRIIGGYIDRDSEFREAVGLLPTQDVIFKHYSVVSYYMQIMKQELNIIDKILIHLRTPLKLDVQFPNGEFLLSQEALPLAETHELLIEGMSEPVQIKSTFLEMLKMSFKFREIPKDLKNLTIVDLDYILKGNLHKDNEYL